MFSLASEPSQYWIVAYDYPTTQFDYLDGDTALPLLAVTDTSALVLKRQSSNTSVMVLLNIYGDPVSTYEGYNYLDTDEQFFTRDIYNNTWRLPPTPGGFLNTSITSYSYEVISDNASRANLALTLTEVCTDSSGNTYAVGYDYDSLNNIYYAAIAKFNSASVTQWIRRISPTSGETIVGSGAIDSPTGEVYLWASNTTNSQTVSKSTLFKLSSTGTVTWQRTISYSTSQATDITSVVVDSTGANIYLFVKDYSAGFYSLLKISSAGTLVWQKNINLQVASSGNPKISIDSSSNIYLIFHDYSYAGTETGVRLLKLDSAGSEVFDTCVLDPAAYGSNTYGNPLAIVSGNNVYYSWVAKHQYIAYGNYVYRAYTLKIPTSTTSIPNNTYSLTNTSNTLVIDNDINETLSAGTALVTTPTFSTTIVATSVLTRTLVSDNAWIIPATLSTNFYKAAL